MLPLTQNLCSRYPLLSSEALSDRQGKEWLKVPTRYLRKPKKEVTKRGPSSFLQVLDIRLELTGQAPAMFMELS